MTDERGLIALAAIFFARGRPYSDDRSSRCCSASRRRSR